MSVLVADTIVSLPDLASMINRQHRACESMYSGALSHAFEAGRFLTAAKEQLAHGDWGTWCEANVECSTRTAQVYMQLAAASPQIQEAQTSANFSISQALKQVQKPKERKPTTNETIDALRSQVTTQPTPEQPKAIGGVGRDPTQVFTDLQDRKRNKSLTLLHAVNEALEDAQAPRLSDYARAEVLRGAAKTARDLHVALDELALSFES